MPKATSSIPLGENAQLPCVLRASPRASVARTSVHAFAHAASLRTRLLCHLRTRLLCHARALVHVSR